MGEKKRCRFWNHKSASSLQLNTIKYHFNIKKVLWGPVKYPKIDENEMAACLSSQVPFCAFLRYQLNFLHAKRWCGTDTSCKNSHTLNCGYILTTMFQYASHKPSRQIIDRNCKNTNSSQFFMVILNSQIENR